MRTPSVSMMVVVCGLAALVGVAMAQPEGPERGRGAPTTPQQFVDRMFPQIDTDADGEISKAEAEGKPIEQFFAEIDANSDGAVTKVELITWLEKRQEAAEKGQVEDFDGGMRIAGRALRGLRRSALDSSTRDADLKAVAMIEAGLVGAKLHVSEVEMAPQAKEKYGDDHAAFETGLRMGLLKAIGDAVNLERAVTEGHSDDAKAARETLVQAMKDGHDAFQPPDDEDEGGERAPGRERGRGPGR